MSTNKGNKTELWLRPLETDGSAYDDCIQRRAERLDLRTGNPGETDETLEWLVIEGLLRAWDAPRDS